MCSDLERLTKELNGYAASGRRADGAWVRKWLATAAHLGGPVAAANRLLLAHGREWTPAPLPSRFARRLPKRCFGNALGLANQAKGLAYCEGYAISGYVGLPLPVEHAWCVSADGTVVDPTWTDSDASVYFGIAFAPAFAKSAAKRNGGAVVFQSRRYADPIAELEPREWFPEWLVAA